MILRTRYTVALVASIGVLAGMLATPGAGFDCFRSSANSSACGERLTFTVTGDVRPRALPERETAPVALNVRGAIPNEDGSPPPSLRELVFDLDRNVKLDPTAFPVCEPIHGSTRDVRRDLSTECPDSIVGRGTAKVMFASGLPTAQVPLTFFNAGVVDGVIGLAVQTTILVPVTTGVTIERVRKGRYGHAATWGHIVLAGGDASLTKFNFWLKRGYVRARCTDGKLLANITKALFRDEGEGPKTSTILKGVVIRPCTPKP
jgi:hypothetical protein